MSNDQPSRRPAGKAGGGAPMGSTVSIIIAVVAVVVGFLVLRNISDSDGGSASVDPGSVGSVAPANSGDIAAVESTTVTTAAGPPTTPALDFNAAQVVIVANASGLGGAAGQYTKALMGLGFTTGTPTDATTPKLDLSVVYYVAGAETVAASVAQAMGALDGSGVLTMPIPTPPPISGGILPAGATVLVMLGTDLAGKALPISAGTTTTTTILPTAPIDVTTSSSTA